MNVNFLFSRCTLELSWNFLKNNKCPGGGGGVFSSKALDVISNEQPYLKAVRLYGERSLFAFFCFIFSASISFILCFPISPFFCSFQAFIKYSRKALFFKT